MATGFRFAGDLSRLSKALAVKVSNNKEMRQRIDDFLLDEAEYYQSNSPIGATGELKESWEVIPSRKASNTYSYLTFAVINNASRSANRIGGREPGKMPPIEPIAAWAAIVLGDAGAAYPVAKKIAREGTDRYKAGTNWVGIDYLGNSIPDGRIDTFKDRLVKYINNQ
jgi:hypothetical protein